MACEKKHMCLYAVTDRAWVGTKSLYEQVEEALQGGVSCLQLREKDMSSEEFLNEALKIKELCNKYHVPFIINDDVEVALRCGADGIHIGQHDMDAAQVRRLIGDKMILGVSAQTVMQAKQAVADGADYLGVGAVFPTSTKLDADYVNHTLLTEITSAVDIPVVAIGGISKSNIMQLKGTGIDGVALVSAIFAADDIKKECRELKILSKQAVFSSAHPQELQGCIFDLDGTLLDSMYIWDTMGEDYLKSSGVTPSEDVNERIKVMSLVQAAEYFRSEYGLTASVESICDGVNSLAEELYYKKLTLKAGVKDFLLSLHENKIPMCVATATDKHLVSAALERNGVLHCFNGIFTCTEVGTDKHEPDIYNAALAELGVPKSNVLVFEDALHAIKTAKQAGYTVVGVEDATEEKNQDLIIELADCYINSFEELKDIL